MRTITPQTQAAIDAINASVGNTSDDKQKLIAAKCRALIFGYAARWADQTYIPIVVEQLVQADLINPDTQAKSRTFRLAGKLDLVVGYHNKRILFDHKSASQDIVAPDATYWRQLAVGSQVAHYLLLEWLNGRKCDGAVWDVLRKPTIEPRKLANAEITRTCSNQSYCNVRMSDETMWSLQVSSRETLEMYEARLAINCIKERPEWYFQRQSVPRLDSELLTYAKDLWGMGQLILEARRNKRWPKHPHSCMTYNSACAFLGICSGFDRADSPNWQPRKSVHSELTPDFDKNTLTYSSITTFQTCPRKFYYRYELGIERIAEEKREALFFGSLLHCALEAYWLALMPAEKKHDSDTCTTSDNDNDCAETLSF